ncbi:DUF523 and DUF1722 domain-containing protein [candidate division KSB1 bacterium]|nr:DUF523 and DUF1722 domain-containing protein [candidate division KSB1 bacterium]
MIERLAGEIRLPDDRTSIPSRPKLGISTCLLGENVRYDGGHKLDRFLRDTLGPFVQWVPVCPETECGLSVPREAMRLEGDVNAPHLVTVKSRVDITDRMLAWSRKRLDVLAGEDLSGYIFKTKSPSSGMRDIKVYNARNVAVKKGVGLFAREFMKRFPLMPVEDEGRLHDPGLRENFIERIFVYKRWQDLLKSGPTAKGLVDFHTEHKLLIMAHSPQHLRTLGSIVARANASDQTFLFREYVEILLPALKLPATVKKNVNVLHHIMGYFKKILDAGEKRELLEVFERYFKGYIPLIVPVTLLNHYVYKYNEPYLRRQMYLHPHPVELMLRNHV